MMGYLDHVGSQCASAVNEFILAVAFDVSGQEKRARTVDDAQDNGVIIVGRSLRRIVGTRIENFDGCITKL